MGPDASPPPNRHAHFINFISFAYFTAQDSTAGALFSIFVIAVTACEMAIALAIIVTMYRRHHSLDADQLRDLHD